MEIELEEQEKFVCAAPGLYQFMDNGLFEPSLLALLEDYLVIYNDVRPDSITENKAYYSSKERFALSEIQHVIYETLHGSGEIESFKRFNIIQAQIEKSFFFYVRKKDLASADKLFAQIKKSGVRTSKRGVDL